MWTIPSKEKKKRLQKATVGALDPAMRKYIASDTILFSVPASRFNNMAKKIERSFANENNWLSTVKKCTTLRCTGNWGSAMLYTSFR
jgi:glycerol-3-phosphate dehydrogenase